MIHCVLKQPCVPTVLQDEQESDLKDGRQKVNLTLTLTRPRPGYPPEPGPGGEFVSEQLPHILTGHKTKTKNKHKDTQSGVRQSGPNKQKGLMLELGSGVQGYQL